RGQMRFEHVVVCIILLGVCTAPYLGPHKASTHVSVAGEVAHPEMGRGGGTALFTMAPRVMAKTTVVSNEINWAEWQFGFVDGKQRLDGPGKGLFPAPKKGDKLHLEGEVPGKYLGPVKLTIRMNDVVIGAASLPPGPFRRTMPITRSFAG